VPNSFPFALTLGAITFLLTVIWGGPFIEIMRRLKIGQLIREDSPDWLESKAGTPTMGGILILIPVLFITLTVNGANLLRRASKGRSVSSYPVRAGRLRRARRA
jgi:phospho-N-acetylmuramoyl-pentapeptide-transferase